MTALFRDLVASGRMYPCLCTSPGAESDGAPARRHARRDRRKERCVHDDHSLA